MNIARKAQVRQDQGFTLIELMIVVAIIAIIASIASILAFWSNCSYRAKMLAINFESSTTAAARSPRSTN